jgi:hypothetical protein
MQSLYKGLFNVVVFLLITVLLGEVFLRIVYHDGGRSTSLGPGGRDFIYTVNKPAPPGTPQFRVRGPRIDHPEEVDGKKRILVFGDSITFGQGVKNWTDVYTAKLLQFLNAGKDDYEMDVFAQCGWEIDTHFRNLKKWAKVIHPDIIIYQWYTNDMELDKTNAPYFKEMPWQKIPFHKFLKRHSFLWYFLDDRLSKIVPTGMASYPEYLLTDYAPGTYNWMLFEIYLNAFAQEASKWADRVIIMLYPALPYNGLQGKEYVLKSLHENVKKVFSSNKINFPAAAMAHAAGVDVEDKSSTYGKVRRAEKHGTLHRELTYGPYLGLDEGQYVASFVEKFDHVSKGEIVTNFVSANYGRDILGQIDITDRQVRNGWQHLDVPFHIEKGTGSNIEFHVKYRGNADVAVDEIVVQPPALKTPVEFLDLYPVLKDKKTWTSIFDAHPSKETHEIMAQELYKLLTKDIREVSSP